MAYDGWMTFNGVEVFNVARVAQLAGPLGIDTVWITPEQTQWIQDELAGIDYDEVSSAPWYDAGFPASGEFGGVMPLSVPGLDDSTGQRDVTEYVTDGGHAGIRRNATLPLVVSAAIVASTERGAEYGLRWLTRTLTETGATTFCAGADLRYFRYAASGGGVAHRRDVSLTRSPSVTRKRVTDCSSTWLVTFTLTAADSFEYSEPFPQIELLGGAVEGPGLHTSGSLTLIEEECPVYNYTPLYDPLYPALVPAPVVPDFLPNGWGIFPGMTFDRFWARLNPFEPSHLNTVPLITLTTDDTARMVRVSVWDGGSPTNNQCGPLFSAVVSYLPPGFQFIIDGEQGAAYVWDGFSPVVRRAESLLYAPDGNPVEWTAFNHPAGLLVTLDIFNDSDLGDGDSVRASLALIQKSD